MENAEKQASKDKLAELYKKHSFTIANSLSNVGYLVLALGSLLGVVILILKPEPQWMIQASEIVFKVYGFIIILFSASAGLIMVALGELLEENKKLRILAENKYQAE